HEALVVDALARDASPEAGNERLLERVAGHPRLHPAWCGAMSAGRELPPPDELVARMREHGVVALYLFYGHINIRLDEWAIDDLLAELERAGCPLFLCPNSWWPAQRSEATEWDNVARICRTFPDLPVIVTEYRQFFTQRTVYAALAAFPNLRLELSSLWRYGVVEYVCEHFGAEQLVWGSQLPIRDPGAVLGQLNCSNISGEELGKIAGGNLRELFSWNENFRSVADQVSFPEPDDELHRAARDRLDLSGEEFYDCHGHMGWSGTFHLVHQRADEIAAELDRHGVRKCIIFGLEGILGDEKYCNDLVAEVVAKYPDHFLGLTLVSFHHGEEKLRAEMQRGLDLGLRGVKIIGSYQGYPAEGPLIDVCAEFCHERGLFILNHDWGSPAQIERLCTTYPGACYLTGHSNPNYGEVTRRVDNLFICSCPFHRFRDTDRYVEIYGADRILFGSDLCDLPIGWGMMPIMFAHISEEDKRKILGGNLKRLLEKYSTG
ncbi:MAG TPA: amidohydrolase family protein, partial [Armatimonadota bacterium]|nr:amidohydrolase family protein [Armatimonadota bacterium]